MAEVTKKDYLELSTTPGANAGYPWVGASADLAQVEYKKSAPVSAE
jgi:hypothetical protein